MASKELWAKLDGTPALGDVKMTKFEIGQRVVNVECSNLKTHNEYEEDVARGVVVALYADEQDNVRVKWDSKWMKPNPEKISSEKLIAEEDANKILSKLDKEYEAWASPIREKLKEAGELLREADRLAQKQGRNLVEMYVLTGELTNAMDEVGWRTSSLSC